MGTDSSTAQQPYYEVGAATRLFDDSEDTAPGRNVCDLALLLQGLEEVAADRIGGSGFDRRRSMADRADDMPMASGFVGIGVCSLGPFKRAWTEARASAIAAPGLAEMNVPSMWRIRLIDGTRIEVFRHAGEMREDIWTHWCWPSPTVSPGAVPPHGGDFPLREATVTAFAG